MENIIIIAIVLAIVLGIIYYLYKAKKRGETCIGCPYAKQCANRKNGCGSGDCHKDNF
ncbi:MAG: FeoB-associated Cys-rich membrane protein [Clostridium sp.]|nr:FeoB-associated Cys-rich membrane protein [Clostridium sp.]MCM1171601.1 FeoB-associated Cys-rich membrane protein [Clostridium sp.]MCM1207584.1 FeoB-associated Cys-rich membrane protein [Ruminococcus sp.]